MSGPHLFFECEMEAPEPVELAAGEAVVFSAPCPGRGGRNEDAAAIVPLGDGASALLMVADGLGGAAYGEQAAKLAVSAVADAVGRAAGGGGRELRNALLDGLEEGDRRIRELGSEAGTTVAAVEVGGESLRPFSVGDSMILHLGRKGGIEWRNVPQSPIGYAVEIGLLDEREALHHPDRNLVLNVVGSPGMWVEVGSASDLEKGDTVLVATDGLADNLHFEEIAAALGKGPLEAGMRELTAEALRRMSSPAPGRPSKPDDLTVVAFRR